MRYLPAFRRRIIQRKPTNSLVGNVVVLIGALLMAAGGIIALVNPAMLVSSTRTQINGAVHIYAGYLASRNLCIAALLSGL